MKTHKKAEIEGSNVRMFNKKSNSTADCSTYSFSDAAIVVAAAATAGVGCTHPFAGKTRRIVSTSTVIIE